MPHHQCNQACQIINLIRVIPHHQCNQACHVISTVSHATSSVSSGMPCHQGITSAKQQQQTCHVIKEAGAPRHAGSDRLIELSGSAVLAGLPVLVTASQKFIDWRSAFTVCATQDDTVRGHAVQCCRVAVPLTVKVVHHGHSCCRLDLM